MTLIFASCSILDTSASGVYAHAPEGSGYFEHFELPPRYLKATFTFDLEDFSEIESSSFVGLFWWVPRRSHSKVSQVSKFL